MVIADNTTDKPVLLTPARVAKRLAVPTSWIYEQTRHRADVRNPDPFPVVRLGKYVRFDWAAVEEWLRRQSERKDS